MRLATIAAAALAAGTVLAPAWAGARQHADASAPAVSRQRAQVKRLEHAVAGQEAGGRAAARRLQEKDARIAELQRQLQAVQAAGSASKSGQ